MPRRSAASSPRPDPPSAACAEGTRGTADAPPPSRRPSPSRTEQRPTREPSPVRDATRSLLPLGQNHTSEMTPPQLLSCNLRSWVFSGHSTTPLPPPQTAPTKTKFNYEQMRHTYVDAARFQRWTAVVARHKSLQGARVLSSGCGAGGSVVAWWTAGAAEVVGLEIDPALVKLASLRVAGLPAVTAELYDGHAIPLDDASSSLGD